MKTIWLSPSVNIFLRPMKSCPAPTGRWWAILTLTFQQPGLTHHVKILIKRTPTGYRHPYRTHSQYLNRRRRRTYENGRRGLVTSQDLNGSNSILSQTWTLKLKHREKKVLLTGVISKVIEKKIERINECRQEIALPRLHIAIGSEKK